MNNETKNASFWQDCLYYLSQHENIDQKAFETWLKPLEAKADHDNLLLLAPNHLVYDHVKNHFLPELLKAAKHVAGETKKVPHIQLQMESTSHDAVQSQRQHEKMETAQLDWEKLLRKYQSHLNAQLTFENFVSGQSNQLAYAAAKQVGENPERVYNPLVIYGDVGLGKTHLMQAAGNLTRAHQPDALIVYLHSERFVANMVKALQHNKMEEFKHFYRSADVILVDDIQFFAGKERSQEEFFHTFNALLDSQRQVILTSDRYPKELIGLEERLKSRFAWGLIVGVEPPELETRVAILISKAAQSKVVLSHEVAFFIAQHIQSNVRELEGALKRVLANAHFTGQPINLNFAKEALKDLLALQAKLIRVDHIQRVVANHYKINVADLLSKKRQRVLAFPRQVAMTLAKELTDKSLPEIARLFCKRDHSTVIHACRKIKERVLSDPELKEDYEHLLRTLSS